MIRSIRVPRAVGAARCGALALLAAACGKEGSPPSKGPAADRLPHHQVARTFALPAYGAWTRAERRGHAVGAEKDQPRLGSTPGGTASTACACRPRWRWSSSGRCRCR